MGLPYTWRKAMLAPATEGCLPVQVSPELEALASPPGRAMATPGTLARRLRPSTGRIEVDFPKGVRVRIDGGVDGARVAYVPAAFDGR